jgi:hypothetical protein
MIVVKKKSIQKIWQVRESGLLVPDGIVSDLTKFSSQTFLAIKKKAQALEQLYSENKITIPSSSDLAQLIREAKDLSDSWLMGQADKHQDIQQLRVCQLSRIVAATLPLRDVPDRRKFLSILTKGSLDPLDRKQSLSKDTLWELELWASLKRRRLNAVLEEPPDIVVVIDHSRIGVACKKLYSEKHVQNVLSEAVAQIEESFDYGIVAVNLDDLTNKFVRAKTSKDVNQHINDLNARFIERHERHLSKYLSSARLIMALVSTTVLTEIQNARVRFNEATRLTIWEIPGLPPEKDRVLQKFYDILMG